MPLLMYYRNLYIYIYLCSAECGCHGEECGYHANGVVSMVHCPDNDPFPSPLASLTPSLPSLTDNVHSSPLQSGHMSSQVTTLSNNPLFSTGSHCVTTSLNPLLMATTFLISDQPGVVTFHLLSHVVRVTCLGLFFTLWHS